MFEVGKKYEIEFNSGSGESTFVHGTATQVEGPLLKIKAGTSERVYNTLATICVAVTEWREPTGNPIYRPMKTPTQRD